MKIRILIICFCTLFSSSTLFAQGCRIIETPVNSAILSSNKIKTLSVFVSEAGKEKKISEKFIFGANGCAIKYEFYNNYETPPMPVISEYSVNILERENVFIKSYTKDKVTVILEKDIEYFSGTGKILKKVNEDGWSQNAIRKTYFYDTLNTANESYTVFVYHTPTGDTISYTTHIKNKKEALDKSRYRNGGVWESSETITAFSKEKEGVVKVYRNGTKINEYGFGQPSKNKNDNYELTDERNYGLPVPVDKVDTIYTNDPINVLPITKVKKENSLYYVRVITQGGATDEKKIKKEIFVFSSKNNLLLWRYDYYGNSLSLKTEYGYKK